MKGKALGVPYDYRRRCLPEAGRLARDRPTGGIKKRISGRVEVQDSLNSEQRRLLDLGQHRRPSVETPRFN
ncbi:MAG TPA: hypothetical protein PKX21_01030 [Candidatus Pacearchaeota archaeon]|nr:hypothetical protein [Candidatus Pacearchaeota archaeon]